MAGYSSYEQGVTGFQLPAFIPQGERNHTLFKYATSLWAKENSEEELREALRVANSSNCEAPLSDSELMAIVSHVVRDYPQGRSVGYIQKSSSVRTLQHNEAISASILEGVGINDRELSKLFADIYRDRLRYVNQAKGWYAFNGSRWLTETQGGNCKAAQYMKDFIKKLLIECACIQDDSLRETKLKAANAYNQQTRREKLLKDCRSELDEDITAFDSNLNLFNVKNGTIELEPFKFREARATDMITKQAGCPYDPNANSREWNSFIKRTFAGHEELASFLQCRLSLALAGDTSKECFYILYGETRTGKSTFTETIKSVFGDYATTSQPETFAKNKRSSQQASPDYAAWQGARLVLSPEPSEDLYLSADLLKQITGGDSLPARKLNENLFVFHPFFTLFFNTNYLPNTTDQTLFTSDRVNVIKFNNVVPKTERDENLKKRLWSEESLSSVLNWLLQGLSLQKVFNLKTPKSVEREVTRYASESDRLGLFIDECCEVSTEGKPEGEYKVTVKQLYAAYKVWCTDCGCYPVERKKLLTQLSRRGYKVKNKDRIGGNNASNVLQGLRLKRSLYQVWTE